MAQQQPKSNTKSPKSEMIRVPTALKSAVRELARLHRAGHTNAILHGLQTLIADIDSNNDISNSSAINQLEQRASHSVESDIKKLEQQLEVMNGRIQQLELAYNQMVTYLNNKSYKRQSYQQPSPTKARRQTTYTEENLAARLRVDPKTLHEVRVKSKTLGEFISWSKGKDPSGLGWEYNSDDALYHLVQ